MLPCHYYWSQRSDGFFPFFCTKQYAAYMLKSTYQMAFSIKLFSFSLRDAFALRLEQITVKRENITVFGIRQSIFRRFDFIFCPNGNAIKMSGWHLLSPNYLICRWTDTIKWKFIWFHFVRFQSNSIQSHSCAFYNE